jgi:hypothetical protein
LQERHTAEPAGVAAEGVAAQHEVDLTAHHGAQGLDAPRADRRPREKIDAVVQGEHDMLGPALAQVGGQVGDKRGGIGRDGGTRMQRREPRQGQTDHANHTTRDRSQLDGAQIEVGIGG